MQSIFIKNRRNHTNLTTTWEQRKLKDVTQRVQGNDGRMDLPTLTISAGYGWLDQRDRFSANIAGKEQKNYTLLRKGELSYNHGNSKLAKYGTVFSLRTYEEALVPRVYHSFKVTDEADADFIEYVFATKLPDKELGKLISSGARMDGLLNINYDEFMGIKITMPSVEEQKQLSDYFRHLDHLITLHQRKYSLLFIRTFEILKEACFFLNVNAWEQREFGNVFEEYSEKNHEELPPLTIIQGKGTILRDESDRNLIYDKAGLKNYKLVNKDDFILHLRSFEGGLEVANSKGIVSPAYHIFHGENVDTGFYYPFFRSKFFISVLLKPHVYGIRDGKSIDVDGMKTIKIPYPKIEEQQAIGNYFKSLDNLITLHQRKPFQRKNGGKNYVRRC